MKEYMYTYHYYKNRCIMKHTHSSSYIFDTVLLAGVTFLGIGVLVLVK